MKNESRKICMGIVGMNFGSGFIEPFQAHPDVAEVAICDMNTALLAKHGDAYCVKRRYQKLEEILADKEIDAIHLNTPIPFHAQHAIAVMKAGKHCACAVPMATSLEDLAAIVATAKQTGMNYMMMATHAFTRQTMHVEELLAQGKLGRLQFLRGAHYQDMENWPAYWNGLPPMLYASHAVAPCFVLAKSRAVKVHCFGSGWMREELRKPYNNPFPVETAIFRLEKSELAMEITRSHFHLAHGCTCMFNAYGENGTFEWQQQENEQPLLIEMEPVKPGSSRAVKQERITVPNYLANLPELLRADKFQWMHGAIPQLVHEFTASIVEGRKSKINECVAANWTAAGICAHASAMRDGAEVIIPGF